MARTQFQVTPRDTKGTFVHVGVLDQGDVGESVQGHSQEVPRDQKDTEILPNAQAEAILDLKRVTGSNSAAGHCHD